ncbi:MAG: hypothetical protein HC816_13605 [Leptolyngbyaceae cyanobacterium RM1_1_2]|nr:hypothetical protein [Leptolyngbyaceae cyanobacterium RM1_1_2]
MNQLEDLLQQCTVKLSLSGQPDWGTGFFVAPGLILTCAHVVRKAADLQVTVSCPAWQQPLSAVVKAKADNGKTLDIALLELLELLRDHPCVLLDEEPVAIGQALYSYGYLESYTNAAPVRPVNEGLTGDTPPLLKLQGAQIEKGISGAALLNLKSGKVCGIVKETRDRSFDLGGGAIPTRVILGQFPELRELQQAFHRRDRQWVNLIAQPIIDSSIEKNQAQPQVSNNRSFFVLDLFTPNLSKSEQLSSHEKNRFRQALLDRVRKSWIKGILEQSLFNQVQIELGLERCTNTLSLDYEVFEQLRQPLPEKAKISEEFFDQLGLGRSLLILGESGVGKTTILLELTRDLLSRAEQDISLPIPVVLASLPGQDSLLLIG